MLPRPDEGKGYKLRYRKHGVSRTVLVVFEGCVIHPGVSAMASNVVWRFKGLDGKPVDVMPRDIEEPMERWDLGS